MSLDRIKKKLVADCSQCDALCCNAPSFETPLYKKSAGVQCKNLDCRSLQCKIYEKRENLGYQFCLKFDCHGAGQAVTKIFRELGYTKKNNKIIEKIRNHIFISTYIYLSTYLFPDQKIQAELDQNVKKNTTPFVNKVIDTLGNEISEDLNQFIKSSQNRIKEKLVADCKECEALCCNGPQFDTPTYKKSAGVPCKNLDRRSFKCQIYENRGTLGYEFCQKFDCHGAGQAVTKLFRKLGRNRQDNKFIEKIQYEVFVNTYLYLSEHYYPDQKPLLELNTEIQEDIESFVDKTINMISEDLNEHI
jgi:hypothetical protein